MGTVKVDNITNEADNGAVTIDKGLTITATQSLGVDDITDAAGTGAPDMSNGIVLSGGAETMDVYDEFSGSTGGANSMGYRATRIGNVVTITAGWDAYSSGDAITATTVIPANMRPNQNIGTYHINKPAGGGDNIIRMIVETGGTIRLQGVSASNLSTGSATGLDALNVECTVSFVV